MNYNEFFYMPVKITLETPKRMAFRVTKSLLKVRKEVHLTAQIQGLL
jgi:hypothetical protein